MQPPCSCLRNISDKRETSLLNQVVSTLIQPFSLPSLTLLFNNTTLVMRLELRITIDMNPYFSSDVLNLCSKYQYLSIAVKQCANRK